MSEYLRRHLSPRSRQNSQDTTDDGPQSPRILGSHIPAARSPRGDDIMPSVARDHKYGNCQRPQVHYRWMRIVSLWHSDMLFRRTYATNTFYPSHIPQHLTLVTPANTSLPDPNIAQPAGHTSIQQPSTPTQSPLSSSSSTTTATSSSFHDSGYSTAHSSSPSSVVSEIALPLVNPALVFPSPPSSIWSLDPPTPTTPSSEASTESGSSTIRSTSSGRSSTHSAHSQSSSSSSPLRSVLALVTELTTILTASTPSSVSRSTRSRSSTATTSTRRSSRSQAPSPRPDPVAASLATALTAGLEEHLTSALTRIHAQPGGLATLTPLFQALAGARTASRRSSTASTPPSSSSSAPSSSAAATPQVSNSAAPAPPHLPTPPSTSSSPTNAAIRRPLTDACYVCTLPIDQPTDAVWCRASCGRNLHVECFALWAETRVNLGRSVQCGYW